MDPATIPALVNFGIGGAVIVVVIVFLREMKARDEANQSAAAKRDEEMAKREEAWRAFFLQIRTGDARVQQDLAAAMNRMADNVSALTDKLAEHDDRARSGIEEIRRAAEGIKTARRGRPPARE